MVQRPLERGGALRQFMSRGRAGNGGGRDRVAVGEQLREARQIGLSIERNGTPMTFAYEIEFATPILACRV